MYLHASGDMGLSSRNPDYAGDPGAMIEYTLENGQQDAYPAAWALPLPVLLKAMEHVREHGTPPPFVFWHDDAEDPVIGEVWNP